MSPSWRWNNIPLPEPHIIGILASGALHLARPWGISGDKRLYRVAGWSLVGAGVAISASAVRAASDVCRLDATLSWRFARHAKRVDVRIASACGRDHSP